MKKFLFCFLLLVLSTSVAFACEEKFENPIEAAFNAHYDKAQLASETRTLVGKELEAWENELQNAAKLVKRQYKFQEDKQLIDDYLFYCKKTADTIGTVKMLEWSDLKTAPNDGRQFGTGAGVAMLHAKVQVYKQATQNLINSYLMLTDKPYEYIFVDDVKI